MIAEIEIYSQFSPSSQRIEVTLPEPPSGFAMSSLGFAWFDPPVALSRNPLVDGRHLDIEAAVEFTIAGSADTVRIPISASNRLAEAVTWWHACAIAINRARDGVWNSEVRESAVPGGHEWGEQFL